MSQKTKQPETNIQQHANDEKGARLKVNRREFMRISGVMTAATAIVASGCQKPVEKIVPFVERPEELTVLGKPLFYTTALDGHPAIVRTREGRPIFIAPHVKHPSGLGLTVRNHAAILDLYDPDRAQSPLVVQRGTQLPTESSWDVAGRAVIDALKAHKGKIALVTRPQTGPATGEAIARFCKATGARHVAYDSLGVDAVAKAWQAIFGAAPKPVARLDKADVIVGYGAEFIDVPNGREEGDFAQSHHPERKGGMAQFFAFEGRLSLTGANADTRVRVRDGHLPYVAMAILHDLLTRHNVGPLAMDSTLVGTLAAHSIDAVSKRTGVDAKALRRASDALAAKPGKAIVLGGGSASTGENGLALEAAVNLTNYTLNAFGSVFDLDAAKPVMGSGLGDVQKLLADVNAGKIEMLILHGVNPVYDLPMLDVAAALDKAKVVVSLNDRLDETSVKADWLAPASHPFESWGDWDFGGGVVSVQQPVIQPLYRTHGFVDILVAWGGQVGTDADFAAAIKAVEATPPSANPDMPGPSLAYLFMRGIYRQRFYSPPENPLPKDISFERFWEGILRTGFLESASAPVSLSPVNGYQQVLAGIKPAQGGALELLAFPHHAHYDGGHANNGWLYEFPDPITRVTWGDWVSIAPRRFDEMGLENGDLIDIKTDGATITLPAYRHAGMHNDEIGIPLGFGRKLAGKIGSGIGQHSARLLKLENGSLKRAGLSVTIAKNGGHDMLAIPQGADALDRKRRPIVPATTLSAYEKDKTSGTWQQPGGESLWPEHKYEPVRWAMSIDLSKCNGCGKCTLACQTENNIPVVGKKGVTEGREMAWLRIDRYYDAPEKDGGWDNSVWDAPLEVVEEPQTLFEPMLCQHCENAPCETVCPFSATMHSEDGVNQQVYNRCVGTRYCSNNCPYKVRRFNWFEYTYERTNWLFNMLVPELKTHANLNVRGKMQMKNNPEVTVRTRGVMEKCSFCIQRIRAAYTEAKKAGHPKEFKDGDVIPACMEVCPTGAISFGNINDAQADITQKAKSPRAMKLLKLTGVNPSISYLTKVRNDKS